MTSVQSGVDVGFQVWKAIVFDPSARLCGTHDLLHGRGPRKVMDSFGKCGRRVQEDACDSVSHHFQIKALRAVYRKSTTIPTKKEIRRCLSLPTEGVEGAALIRCQTWLSTEKSFGWRECKRPRSEMCTVFCRAISSKSMMGLSLEIHDCANTLVPHPFIEKVCKVCSARCQAW